MISFDDFFQGEPLARLHQAVDLALDEDGRDVTSLAVFTPEDRCQARIVAKQETLVVGLPLIALVLAKIEGGREAEVRLEVEEGARAASGTRVAVIAGPTRAVLKAERVILNFMARMSGIANLTSRYVDQLRGSRTNLLDTRKTMPGLRWPDKYAVLRGGGRNHRRTLEEMVMLKDNHIDQAGSIASAVERVRAALRPCPPIEVECRTLDDVREAAACRVERIMLDNMGPALLAQALPLIPPGIESEVSGNVSLETIADIAKFGPDFISVGKITHSAPAADFSMQIVLNGTGQ